METGNTKFKISTRRWNEQFELPVGSYFISDIPDYFEYIYIYKKKHGEKTINPSIRIYINKIESSLKLKQDFISNF